MILRAAEKPGQSRIYCELLGLKLEAEKNNKCLRTKKVLHVPDEVHRKAIHRKTFALKAYEISKKMLHFLSES